MEKSNKKIVLLALIMAAVTTFIVFLYINTDAPAQEERISEKACVAVNDIAAGSIINANDIKVADIDKECIIPGTVRNTDKVIGKIARAAIYQGEQINESRLAEIENLKLSFDLAKGKRAMSIFVNRDTGLTDNLVPGDYVDVIATFTEEKTQTEQEEILYPKQSGVLLQNIRVLAIDGDRGQKDGEPAKENQGQKTVTLEIDASNIEKFAYAAEFGILRLALRGAGDHEPVSARPAVRDNLFK